MLIRRQRARSFGAVAYDYDRYRTGYSARAVDWALRPTARRHPISVLDVGAGTGKLTAALLTRPGVRVTAVEPDPAMIAMLRARLPGTDARVGTAEAIPLPDASVDAVLVGQAWHWFDPRLALPEAARVLRPGGVLAALWNGEDPDAGWIAGFREANGWAERVGPTQRGRQVTLQFPDHPAFGPGEHDAFRHDVPMTTDRMLGWLGTHSWLLAMEPAERSALETRVRAHLGSHPLTSSGSFTLPLVTTVLRAVRR